MFTSIWKFLDSSPALIVLTAKTHPGRQHVETQLAESLPLAEVTCTEFRIPGFSPGCCGHWGDVSVDGNFLSVARIFLCAF